MTPHEIYQLVQFLVSVILFVPRRDPLLKYIQIKSTAIRDIQMQMHPSVVLVFLYGSIDLRKC